MHFPSHCHAGRQQERQLGRKDRLHCLDCLPPCMQVRALRLHLTTKRVVSAEQMPNTSVCLLMGICKTGCVRVPACCFRANMRYGPLGGLYAACFAGRPCLGRCGHPYKATQRHMSCVYILQLWKQSGGEQSMETVH